jgi:hypothetical protein
MTTFPDIQIDGTAYGEELARTPSFQPIPSGGLPGLPPLPGAQTAPSQDEVLRQREARVRTEADRYEQAVLGVLIQVSQWKSGRAVLNEIARHGKPVKITPRLPRHGKWDNAWARAEERTDATRKHRLLRQPDGTPSAGRSRGTGAGSGVEITYITQKLTDLLNRSLAVKVPSIKGHAPETLAFEDEILVHELAHAMRMVSGFETRRRVPGQPGYGNIEELVAIVVANVYRSERKRHGVRNNDHAAWDVMFVDGKNFLKIQFNRWHLQRFSRQHPAFARELSAVNAYFNPFQHLRV